MVDENPYSEYLYLPNIDPAATIGGAGDSVGGAIGSGSGGVGPGPDQSPGTSIINTIINLPTLINDLVNDVHDVLDIAHEAHPLNMAKKIVKVLATHGANLLPMDIINKAESLSPGDFSSGALSNDARNAWQYISNFTFGLFYRGMLEVGLGVDTSAFSPDAQRAVNTSDTMISFAFLLPFIGTAIGTVGHGLFGARWSHAWHEMTNKLSEEMGLSWALGLQIDEAYKVSVGRAIEEAINRQKRGNRMDWPQIRIALKQHIFSDFGINEKGEIERVRGEEARGPGYEVYKFLLENAGFPDDQIDILASLNDVQLPVGDISQLWYRDVINDEQAKVLIAKNGWNEESTNHLFDLYMAKAENSVSVSLRTIARQQFTNHVITEDQYRLILQKANFPSKLITADIEAIKLEQKSGHVLHTVTDIKSEYQHNTINGDEARRLLQLLNYNDTYIAELLHTWDLPPLRKQHQLSQAKVLSYYVSKVLTEDQARKRLIQIGLANDDVDLLIAHPTNVPLVRTHARTPALIITAYVDGALDLSELAPALTATGITENDLPLYVAQANWRKSQRKGSPVARQYPNTADIEKIQKAGLIDFQSAVMLYENVGWSPDWAMLHAEVVNKGPYRKPGPAVFTSTEQAALFLENLGYKVINPPDPRIAVAEGMLYGQGYNILPPLPLPPPQEIGPG